MNLDPGPVMVIMQKLPILENKATGHIWSVPFGVSNAFDELIFHTKYEQNRSIFDNFQNFGPFYFVDTEKPPPKFLIYC